MLCCSGRKKLLSAVCVVSFLLQMALPCTCFKASATESDDCAIIKGKWRVQLVGSVENDTENAYIKKKLELIEKEAQASLETVNITDASLPPWGEVLTESEDMTKQFTNTEKLALAYSAYGTSLYHNSEVREIIIYALEWMYENAYGEDEASNSGWRDTTLHNWWDWQIGSPMALVNILILMEDELDKEFIKKETEVITHFVPNVKDYGSNLISFAKIMIGSGALSGDTERIANAVSYLPNEFLYRKGAQEQGFHEDGTYLFHTKHFYNGAYGVSHLRDLTSAALLLADTSYEMNNEAATNLFSIIFNAVEPIVYGTTLISPTMGRIPNGGRTEARYAINAMVSALELLECKSEYEAEIIRLKQTLKKYFTDNPNNFYEALSLCNIGIVNSIMEDEKVIPREDYVISKSYYNGDRVISHRENFTAAISMSSSRIYNYESINSVNMDGWYIGDGMLYVYTPDNTQYLANWWNGINKYKIPGTTVDAQTRECVSIKQGNEYLSSKDFVGGVDFEGVYSTAAMELESFHNEIGGNVVNSGNGGEQPLHNCSLTAKKAWFMFDNEIVALGTDINANDGYNVYTTIDNRMMASDKIYVNSVEENQYYELSSDTTEYKNTSWINLENQIGYIFPEGEKVSVAKNSDNESFVEAWTEHGISPKNVDYQYIVLPNTDAQTTQEYSLAPQVSVLSNTAALQSVYDNSSGVTGIVFWEKGRSGIVETEDPAIIMYSNDDGLVKMSVADPTHKLDSITLSVEGNVLPLDCENAVTITNFSEKASITIDTSDCSGKSYELSFFCLNENMQKYALTHITSESTISENSVSTDFRIINTGNDEQNVFVLVAACDSVTQKTEKIFLEKVQVAAKSIADKKIEREINTSGLDFRTFIWNMPNLCPVKKAR